MHKVQKSMKPWIEEKEQKPNTVTQSRRVLRKKGGELSWFYKHRSSFAWNSAPHCLLWDIWEESYNREYDNESTILFSPIYSLCTWVSLSFYYQ